MALFMLMLTVDQCLQENIAEQLQLSKCGEILKGSRSAMYFLFYLLFDSHSLLYFSPTLASIIMKRTTVSSIVFTVFIFF